MPDSCRIYIFRGFCFHFYVPDNNARFFTETAAYNVIQDSQRQFKEEMLSATRY